MIVSDLLLERIKDKGYEYCSNFDGLIFIMDKKGYFYSLDKTILLKKKNCKYYPFKNTNIFTMVNLTLFLKKNNIQTKPLFSDYTQGGNLPWKCGCGREYKTTMGQFISYKQQCSVCGRIIREKKVHEQRWNEAKYFLKEKGFDILDFKNLVDVIAKDKDGYKYQLNVHNLEKGYYPLKFYTNNPFTIENLNVFLKRNRNDYRCIDTNYMGNDKKMLFKHLKCKTIFESTLDDMTRMENNYYLGRCPKCEVIKHESFHATALKQVFVHEYPDTICEEKSCINLETNHVLPTDIVNHKLKIAIEIQSQYHDTKYKKKLDEYKKNFWISKNYSFFAPDIRNYSVLEMIQLFFPTIKSIPKYINYEYVTLLDDELIQKLLNEGKTIKEISNMMNYNSVTIRSHIRKGLIKLPKEYKEKVFGIKKIVQLDKNYHLIKLYNSLNEISKNGYATGTIRRVLNGKQKYAYDNIWMYEQDYANFTK